MKGRSNELSKVSTADELVKLYSMRTYLAVLQNRFKNIIHGYDTWKYGLKSPGYPKVEIFTSTNETVSLDKFNDTKITNLMFHFDGRDDVPLFIVKEVDDSGKVISNNFSHFYFDAPDFKSLNFSFQLPKNMKPIKYVNRLFKIWLSQ